MSRWWTFAGLRANTTLGELIGGLRPDTSREENLSIRLVDGTGIEDLKRQLDHVAVEAKERVFPVTDEALESLKFSACLPMELACRTLRERGADPEAVAKCLREPIRDITLG